MQTERFNQLRKAELSEIFIEKNIVEVWRKIVRNQLRSLDIKDLYDHYDFNYNIEERAISIRNEILSGTYKVSQSMTYRIEKKFGICRHLVAPQPTDALVFQVLVEKISKNILDNQPSKNAFYSRDKHSISKPHEADDYNLNMRDLWKRLQKKIYNFNEEKDLIVVTDLSNYYDSIDISELRKVFTSYSKINEVVIDLVFQIIEEISWKPDYLPYSARGLPTTNIEGIRLLAHSFLFEIDEVIKQKTNNSFARWMDDIIIGVDSNKQAIETISAISDMLKSRGLALNVSKTNIYTAEQGYHHFQIEKNRYLDGIEGITKSSENYEDISEEINKQFDEHFTDQSAKYWEKVSKRYITAYGRLGSPELLYKLPQIYIKYPGLRENLLFYLMKIGYSKDAFEQVIEIVKEIDVFDDISLYQICFLLTQWEVPTDNESRELLKRFEKQIVEFAFERKLSSDLYSLLWFKAKYNHADDLLKFIQNTRKEWQKDSFLRRQVTAVLSRLLKTNSIKVENLLSNQISSGIPNTVTLASQILQFKNIEKIDKKLSSYLFPKKKQKPYPLAKFLVLCSVLNSEHIRSDESYHKKIIEHIEDPYYLKWLDAQYNIQ